MEFGEQIEAALQREIKEEINAELENIRYLGMIENIFTFEGQPGHELFFIYQADFKDKKLYGKKTFKILDSKIDASAKWIEVEQLKKCNFYPFGIIKYI